MKKKNKIAKTLSEKIDEIDKNLQMYKPDRVEIAIEFLFGMAILALLFFFLYCLGLRMS